MSEKIGFPHGTPANSWLLNFEDLIWVDAFTVDEVKELKSHHLWEVTKKTLPSDLMNILLKLNNKSKLEEIYNEFSVLCIDPVQERERHWSKSAVIEYCLLFVNSRKFIRQSRNINFTETQSNCSERNQITEENEEKEREYKSTIDFTYHDIALGFTKVILPMFDKDMSQELIERELEVPKMLRNFLIALAKKSDVDHTKLKTAGIIINGFFISIVVVRFKGSVAVMTTSSRLLMPVSVEGIPRLLPRVLNLIYTYAMTIKDTVDLLKNSGSILKLEAEDSFFPPSV
ncbi:hypothetical protein MFLAVUS_005840 [Mucor flavus]|uniref:Uncharacterized protein n=1 Tax=Mucor flavus TaxID=439312 RepID=A0ABP9YZW6_9FUNG